MVLCCRCWCWCWCRCCRCCSCSICGAKRHPWARKGYAGGAAIGQWWPPCSRHPYPAPGSRRSSRLITCAHQQPSQPRRPAADGRRRAARRARRGAGGGHRCAPPRARAALRRPHHRGLPALLGRRAVQTHRPAWRAGGHLGGGQPGTMGALPRRVPAREERAEAGRPRCGGVPHGGAALVCGGGTCRHTPHRRTATFSARYAPCTHGASCREDRESHGSQPSSLPTHDHSPCFAAPWRQTAQVACVEWWARAPRPAPVATAAQQRRAEKLAAKSVSERAVGAVTRNHPSLHDAHCT